MKTYKCHKEVHAKPMSRGDFYFRQQKMPTNQQPQTPGDEGYFVRYNAGTEDEYESWSPKKQFDEGYEEISDTSIDDLINETDLSFGDAVNLACLGHKLQRQNWSGAGMFFWYVPGNEYPARTEAIKGYFDNDMVPYRAYFAIRTARGDVSTWVPSISDILAADWRVVE